MLVLERLEVFGLARVSQRASGIEVGREHRFLRREYLAGLSHEVYSTHHHHLSIRLSSLASQSQGVANKVGNVLNVANGVVVGQDNGIFLLTQLPDSLLEVYPLGSRFTDKAVLQPLFFQIVCFHIRIVYLFYFLLF